jgi:hypothetical protein
MSAKNDEPGARDAGPHQVLRHCQKRDPTNTRNHQPAQQPSAAIRSASSRFPLSRATATAEAILHEALALGIRVGTDGDELVLIAPMRVPREVRCWFEAKLDELRTEVIAIIQENAEGRA